jgi:hypothetical protein
MVFGLKLDFGKIISPFKYVAWYDTDKSNLGSRKKYLMKIWLRQKLSLPIKTYPYEFRLIFIFQIESKNFVTENVWWVYI